MMPAVFRWNRPLSRIKRLESALRDAANVFELLETVHGGRMALRFRAILGD